MQVSTTRRQIKTSGLTNQHNFNVEINSKTFDILFKQLYSDPNKAIIRELSTNAYDSHIEAGRGDIPFLIKLPNSLSPNLVVRDYGTGLTPDEIHHIYTTVFKSTKTNTNDQVGCLGLGSKSPYSYSDNFLVESYKDGVHYMYNCYLDDNNIPSIGELGQNPTKEENGLKITIAVDEKDFGKFKTAAESVFKHFAKRPTITGQQLNIVEPEYAYEGSIWKLEKHDKYRRSNAYAIMGNIAYPIDVKQLSSNARALLEYPFFIEFNIGELEIDPSREGLHYDKHGRTVRHIEEKAQLVADELKKLIEDSFANAANLWEARVRFLEAKSSLPAPLQSNISNITYKGQALFANNSEYLYFPKDAHPRLIYPHYNKMKIGTVASILPSDKVTVVVNDIKTGFLARCRHHVTENFHNGEKLLLLASKNDSDIDRMLEVLGLTRAEAMKVSELDAEIKISKAVPATIGTKVRAKPTKVLLFDVKHDSKKYAWKKAAVSIEDGGYYVKLDAFDCIIGGTLRGPEYLTKVVRLLEELGQKVPNVIGVRKTIAKKFDSNPKWIDLDAFAQKEIKRFVKTFDYRACINYANETELIFTEELERELIKVLNKDTLYYQELIKVRKNKLYKLHHAKATLLCDLEGIMFDKDKDAKPTVAQDISKTVSTITETYPLLSMLDSYKLRYANDLTEKAKHISSYINCQ